MTVFFRFRHHHLPQFDQPRLFRSSFAKLCSVIQNRLSEFTIFTAFKGLMPLTRISPINLRQLDTDEHA